MMAKEYRVQLTPEEQEELKGLVSKGRAAAYRQTHARILLLSDENQAAGAMKDEEIAQALKVGTATVELVRRRCVEEGLERALGRKEQLNRRPKKRHGQGEAHLVALACSQPPEGRTSWTLHLLADQLVERGIVGSISTETVRRSLKKTSSSLGLRKAGASRPRPMPSSSATWRTYWKYTTVNSRATKCWCVWTKPASNWSKRPVSPCRLVLGCQPVTIRTNGERHRSHREQHRLWAGRRPTLLPARRHPKKHSQR